MYKVGDKILVTESWGDDRISIVVKVTKVGNAKLDCGALLRRFPKYSIGKCHLAKYYYHESTERYKKYLKIKEVE